MTIATLSIATDHIDKKFFDDKNITIINCDMSNVVSVAEHVFSLIFALKKKLLLGYESVVNKTGRAGLNGLPTDVYGQTLGIVGAGKIGRKTIEMAKAFNLNVLCHTLHPENHNDLLEIGVAFVSLDELLSKSDIISVHVPLNETTRNLIGINKINLLKPNVVFINTSKKEVVDTLALIQKAKENINFKVGLDIDFEKYDNLFTLQDKNIIVTPHVAGVTIDSIARMAGEVTEKIIKMV